MLVKSNIPLDGMLVASYLCLNKTKEAAMETIYRGYDIKRGTQGWYIYKDGQDCCDRAFTTEDAACNEIDRWKREQAKQTVAK